MSRSTRRKKECKLSVCVFGSSSCFSLSLSVLADGGWLNKSQTMDKLKFTNLADSDGASRPRAAPMLAIMSNIVTLEALDTLFSKYN